MTDEAPKQATSQDLLELLDLEQLEPGVFLGPPAKRAAERVYGGQTLSQALAAACFTVQSAHAYSLHALFVRPGIPGRPTHYEVHAMHDGKRLCTRKVIAVQRDEVILELLASFAEPEPEAEVEFGLPMPSAPGPGELPSEEEQKQARLAEFPPEAHAYILRPWPIEYLRVGEPGPNQTQAYMRTRGELLDDPNLHRCALTFASDMAVLEPSVRMLGGAFFDPSLQIASLDHALWFHRPFRFDEFLLLTLESVSVGYGRGCSRGLFHDQKGRLVASVVQEGMMRRR